MLIEYDMVRSDWAQLCLNSISTSPLRGADQSHEDMRHLIKLDDFTTSHDNRMIQYCTFVHLEIQIGPL